MGISQFLQLNRKNKAQQDEKRIELKCGKFNMTLKFTMHARVSYIHIFYHLIAFFDPFLLF